MAFYFKPIISISELKPGMHIRHRSHKSRPLIVTNNYGDRATAVFTQDITNPIEWEVLTDDNEKSQQP